MPDDWTCAYCQERLFLGVSGEWVGQRSLRRCRKSPDLAHHLEKKGNQ